LEIKYELKIGLLKIDFSYQVFQRA